MRQFVSACIPCQRAKVIRHTRPATQFIPVPQSRFDHLHVDVVGPLPPSNGFTHLFTIVDRYTRWPEAIPVSDTSTSALCSALLHNWVARFGLPRLITSDRGSQFTSALWAKMSATLGMQLTTTTAYHPQSNGLVERMHRRLKEALKARLTGPDWHSQLPWVLLGLRATAKADIGASPAELVFGAPLTVPGDCLPAKPALPVPAFLRQLHQVVSNLQPQPTAHHPPSQPPATSTLPPDTKFVFIRRDGYKPPLSAAYEGPFAVHGMEGNVITIKRGLSFDKVAASRCKVAVLDQDAALQQPPRRGRPPASASTSPASPPLHRNQPAPPPETAHRPRRSSKLPSRLTDFDMG